MRKLLAVLFLVGCGGDDPSIDGAWVVQLNASCALVADFDTGAGAYSHQQICGLLSGGYGTDGERGSADFAEGGKLALTPTHATCTAHTHTSEVDTYEISSGQLVLHTAEGGITFDRVPEGGKPAATTVQFGCWDADGFTPHPDTAL